MDFKRAYKNKIEATDNFDQYPKKKKDEVAKKIESAVKDGRFQIVVIFICKKCGEEIAEELKDLGYWTAFTANDITSRDYSLVVSWQDALPDA
jgi:hypothetical protein